MASMVEYSALVSDKEIRKALEQARIERSKAFVGMFRALFNYKYKPTPTITANGVASAL